jgi:Tfp pilus assembly protein PilN
MINLLPPEIKQDYRYARRNRILINWTSACLFGLIGISLISGIGLYYMDNSIHNYNDVAAVDEKKLKQENVNSYKAQVASISNNLNLMVHVLSKEILFSDLLNRLGSITPANVLLTNLSIDQNQSAIDISAVSSNYNAATQLQINLQDPNNQVFTKADIISITCVTPKQATNPNYPCTANIRALFTTSNPFLFINKGSTNGAKQ